MNKFIFSVLVSVFFVGAAQAELVTVSNVRRSYSTYNGKVVRQDATLDVVVINACDKVDASKFIGSVRPDAYGNQIIEIKRAIATKTPQGPRGAICSPIATQSFEITVANVKIAPPVILANPITNIPE